jgi:predicted aspartyl protease
MDSASKSFTLQSEGILRVLQTHCGVCPAFDPLSGGTHPKVEQFIGLWDTGATGTVISQECAVKLNLKPISKAKVFHANGESIVNVYAINLFLPNQVGFQFIKVTEGILNGTDLLIGMDIISRGDFAVTNFAGKTTFSFRVPSTQRIDFVEESKPKPIVNVGKKFGRNDACYCGSGKKFKHCHGGNS